VRNAAVLGLVLLCVACSDDKPERLVQPTEERIVFSSSRDGDFEIYTMAPDGTDVRQLTENADTDDSEGRDEGPHWSPDARWIAFSSTRDHPVGGTEPSEVYVMRADGSGERRLTENVVGDFPTGWTDEGEVVFWHCPPEACELRLVQPDGDGERTVYATKDVVLTSRGPDGGSEVRAVVLDREAQTFDDAQHVAIDVESGDRRSVEEGTPSPDGEQMLIETDRDENGRCLFHDCTGHAAELYIDDRRLTRTTIVEGHAVWSPDGTRILFGRIPDEKDDWELWVMNVDGSCARQLTDNTEWDWTPDWAGPREGAGPLEC
jgi:hypothetical protein